MYVLVFMYVYFVLLWKMIYNVLPRFYCRTDGTSEWANKMLLWMIKSIYMILQYVCMGKSTIVKMYEIYYILFYVDNINTAQKYDKYANKNMNIYKNS